MVQSKSSTVRVAFLTIKCRVILVNRVDMGVKSDLFVKYVAYSRCSTHVNPLP